MSFEGSSETVGQQEHHKIQQNHIQNPAARMEQAHARAKAGNQQGNFSTEEDPGALDSKMNISHVALQ